MTYDVEDTVAAIASAPGGAARGILRVSGPGLVACLQGCFVLRAARGWSESPLPRSVPADIRLAPPLSHVSGDLYIWPKRRSYTGQPSAEFHMPGSPPLLEAALEAVCQAGARVAEPGEFTMRAFLAGRVDLIQAEAVLGVIQSRSQVELRTALRQLAGGLSQPLAELRNQLLELLAHLEAGLDFADERIEFIGSEQLCRQLGEVAGVVSRLAARMDSRSVANDEPRVVLRGWPNVGKSSLFNALIEANGALVSADAGTTRDYVTARMDLRGFGCILVDTAGTDLDGGADSLRAAAQSATSDQFAQADLQLLCLDASRSLNTWELAELQQPSAARIAVATKVDAARDGVLDGVAAVRTSSKQGHGLEQLRRKIHQYFMERASADDAILRGTAIRCGESLRQAAILLQSARQAAHGSLGEELVAADIRSALDEIGSVAGVVYTDDILDRIFSRFCIGK